MEHVKQQMSSKRRLKLGDIAESLQLKKFVVKSWEKELGLAPVGGAYGASDIEIFKKIKQLVLVERKPLAQVRDLIGARKLMQDQGQSADEIEHGNEELAEVLAADSQVIDNQEKTSVVAASEIVFAKQKIVDFSGQQAQQKFQEELAFFKQELMRFQSLLNS